MMGFGAAAGGRCVSIGAFDGGLFVGAVGEVDEIPGFNLEACAVDAGVCGGALPGIGGAPFPDLTPGAPDGWNTFGVVPPF